jgi:hypothetical protein
MQLALLALVASAITQPGTAAVQETPVATPAAAGGDVASLVDIGGDRRLWLEWRGAGRPTVILEWHNSCTFIAAKFFVAACKGSQGS